MAGRRSGDRTTKNPVELMPTAYDLALDFLYGRIDYERTPTIPYQEKHLKLQRMERLLALIGNPQRDLAVIHIAGTKGKGSTATMVDAILSAANLKTGLYTSPHLNRLEERIRINGEPCSAEQLVDLVATLQPAVLEIDQAVDAGHCDYGRPTYFEITTAMAMLHFQREAVDYGILEVGLGGRLDSTNVCFPTVTVITSISLDHTKQLGSTLERIAAEKAGIIKPGIPMISGVRDGVAREVIERIANEQQPSSPCITLGKDFDYRYSLGTAECRFDYVPSANALGAPLTDTELGLLGAHQAANASIATTVARMLSTENAPISDRAVQQGLATANCPARIEHVSADPAVIIDAAHNRASIDALLSVLDECFSDSRRLVIFGTTRGKDVDGMLRCLVNGCDSLIFTQYHENPRSYPADKLSEHANTLITGRDGRPTVRVLPDPIQAWQFAKAAAGDDALICVTGSFFLAAELRPVILAELERKRECQSFSRS